MNNAREAWIRSIIFNKPAEIKQNLCDCCNEFHTLTVQTPAYSTCTAWLCEACAAENAEETRQAWADYHSGCL